MVWTKLRLSCDDNWQTKVIEFLNMVRADRKPYPRKTKQNWTSQYKIEFKITTNLSMVNATRFHVEESKSPQRNSSVFHNRHSSSPSNPVLRNKYLSFMVKVTRNSITDTAKSRRLCNKVENLRFRKSLKCFT